MVKTAVDMENATVLTITAFANQVSKQVGSQELLCLHLKNFKVVFLSSSS